MIVFLAVKHPVGYHQLNTQASSEILASPRRTGGLFHSAPRAGAAPLTVWRSSPSAAPTDRPELHLLHGNRTESAGKVLDH
ncbi:hypothetical protein SRHO_G00331130 [Serrasalmus rhombeus]